MTRRVLFQIVVILLLVAPLALAASDSPRVVGRVMSVDDHARTFVVQDDRNKQWSFSWGSDTVFLTRPRQGMRVRVTFETISAGSHVAKRVGVPKNSPRRVLDPGA